MLCVQARQRCGQQRMAEGRQARHVDARLVRPRQGQRMLDHAVQTLPAALHFGPQRERSEEHTSELQSPCNLVCRLLLEKKNSAEVHQPLRQLQAPRTLSRTVGELKSWR